MSSAAPAEIGWSFRVIGAGEGIRTTRGAQPRHRKSERVRIEISRNFHDALLRPPDQAGLLPSHLGHAAGSCPRPGTAQETTALGYRPRLLGARHSTHEPRPVPYLNTVAGVMFFEQRRRSYKCLGVGRALGGLNGADFVLAVA